MRGVLTLSLGVWVRAGLVQDLSGLVDCLLLALADLDLGEFCTDGLTGDTNGCRP